VVAEQRPSKNPGAGLLGDDELVQFGDTVTQVPAEMLVQGQIAMETHKDIDAFNEPATLRQTYFLSVRFPFLVSV